jgi:hypothetical protein
VHIAPHLIFNLIGYTYISSNPIFICIFPIFSYFILNPTSHWLHYGKWCHHITRIWSSACGWWIVPRICVNVNPILKNNWGNPKLDQYGYAFMCTTSPLLVLVPWWFIWNLNLPLLPSLISSMKVVMRMTKSVYLYALKIMVMITIIGYMVT